MGRERCPYKTMSLWKDKILWRALKKEYLDKLDPTEWKHWEMITKSYYCKKDVMRWREELEAKMRAIGVKSAVAQARDPQKGFTAAKWLADSGWKDKVAGRPTKAEKQRQERIAANVTDEVDDLLATMKEDTRRTTLQ